MPMLLSHDMHNGGDVTRHLMTHITGDAISNNGPDHITRRASRQALVVRRRARRPRFLVRQVAQEKAKRPARRARGVLYPECPLDYGT
jgi:hypothetical protein